MSTATETRPAPRAPARGLRRPIPTADLVAGALLVAAASAATCWLLGLPTSHLVASEALYGVLALVLLLRLPAGRGRGIGPANRVTLARAALVLPVIAVALRPAALAGPGAWWLVGLSSAAMALDFFDGRVARATGSASRFGARFDMETDAALLLALATLLYRDGRVGSWVILIGALRYLFLFAGWLWPVLRGDLPHSLRRKTVCVWQGVSLLIALAPITPRSATTPMTATALALLVYSFGADVRWLLARAGATADPIAGHPAGAP